MKHSALGMAALAAALALLPADARADFADAVRAYEAGDYATAFSEWLALAERGDPAAERNIGHLYRMGWSVRQDFDEAAKWYRRAAEKGFARAQANLANMYLRGQGVKSDHAMAVEWFRRAALQGHAVAQYNLGLMYENGLGVGQSDAKAMGWYHLASQTGHRRAQDKLALLIAKSTSELGPLLEAEATAPEPVEPAEMAVPEPVKPAEMAEGPALEGPRREPIEVALDERAPEPAGSAAFEVAVIEPTAEDAGAGAQERDPAGPAPDESAIDEETEEMEVARAGAALADVQGGSAQALAVLPLPEPTEEPLVASLAEPDEPVPDASAFTSAPEPVAADANAADAKDGAAMEEEGTGSLTASLDALKGPSRREREGSTDTDRAAEPDDEPVAMDAADESSPEETAGPAEMAAAEPGEGQAEPAALDDPAVEAGDRVVDEAAIEWDEPPAAPAAAVEIAALGPTEPTAEPALATLDLAPEPAGQVAADANAADADDGAAMEDEEESGFFVAFVGALKGQSRREREGSTEAGRAAEPDDEPVAIDAADDSGPGETPEPVEMAALDPGEGQAGPAALDDPAVEAGDRVVDGTAIEWDEPPAALAAAVEVAALSPTEPTAEDVTPSLGETVEPAPDLVPEPAQPVADANAADADDGAAMEEEEESGFFTAFVGALKGQSRREREGSTEADRAVEPDDEPVAIDAADEEPPEMAALGSAGAANTGGGVEVRVDAEEDVEALALDALRGEAQATEATEVAPGQDERELTEGPSAPDEEAATLDIAALADEGGAADEPGAGAPAIDWREPTESEEETKDEGTAATGLDAVAEADAGVSETEGADSRIIWGKPGLESAALAESDPFVAPAAETEISEPGPPVAVAVREDSAALPVVTAMPGLGVDLEGMSDRERLGAGLAAYRGRDYGAAVTAWLPLAERGNGMAQFYVGGLYLDGTGLPPSRVWAHVFWTLSAERGQEKAGELLEVLAADLLPVELAEARDLAAAWRPVR